MAQAVNYDYYDTGIRKKVVHGRYVKYAKAALPLIQDMYRVRGQEPITEEELQKMGSFSTIEREYAQLDKQAAELIKARAGYAEMTALKEEYEKQAEQFTSEWQEAAGYKKPEADPCDEFLSSEPQQKQACDADEFINPSFFKRAQAGGPITEALNAASTAAAPVTAVADPFLQSVSQDATKNLSGVLSGALSEDSADSARRKEKLKNLQRQLILQELYQTDPVLSGEDPENLARAYETLWRIAPGVALDKEVSRSVLRQLTQSVSVSPHDARSWVDLDKALAQQLQGSTREEAK